MTTHIPQIIETEVCIVGAGPGGTLAALSLAQKGIPSVVVDKASFPRHKADGDYLTPNVWRTLNELDPALMRKFIVQEKDKLSPLANCKIVSPNGRAIVMPIYSAANERAGIPSSWACRRIDFDNFMTQEIVQNDKITFYQNYAIQDIQRLDNGFLLISRDGVHQIQCKMLLIASGSNSLVGRKVAGFQFEAEEYAAGIRAYFSNVKNVVVEQATIVISEDMMPGGMVLIPQPNGDVSVSMMIRSKEVAAKKLNLKEIMLNVLHNHPYLKANFENASLNGVEGASLFLGTKDRKIAGNNYLVIGDAAGLADPINANGVGHAMMTGKMAADIVEKCIQANDFSEQTTGIYSELVAKRLHKSLAKSRFGYRFFAYPKVLIFIANMITRIGDNAAVNELINSGNLAKLLITPMFWYRLFISKETIKMKP